MHQLTLSLSATDFQIRRSQRAKRLRISINPLGLIEVVAPRRASTKTVTSFIQTHHEWIKQKKCQIESMRSYDLDSASPSFVNLPAIEEQWNIIYTSGHSTLKVEKDNVTNFNSLRLTVSRESQTSELLKKWLNEKAKSSLLPWLDRISEETGLDYAKANIRGQKTRWASCSTDKNINLNRCMLFLRPEQVRYLMVHELCHTVEMNHSSRFWKLVRQYVPDYQRQEKIVNDYCYKLPRWAF